MSLRMKRWLLSICGGVIWVVIVLIALLVDANFVDNNALLVGLIGVAWGIIADKLIKRIL